MVVGRIFLAAALDSQAGQQIKDRIFRLTMLTLQIIISIICLPALNDLLALTSI